MRRTVRLLLVVTLLALPLSSQATDPPPLELTVLTAPKEVPAFSSFYVRFRLVNTGSRPLRGCLIELSRCDDSIRDRATSEKILPARLRRPHPSNRKRRSRPRRNTMRVPFLMCDACVGASRSCELTR